MDSTKLRFAAPHDSGGAIVPYRQADPEGLGREAGCPQERRRLPCSLDRPAWGLHAIPVIAEFDGECQAVQLQVTEDAFSYCVLAEVHGACAEAFEAELAGNLVLIHIVDGCRDDHMSLTFGRAVDLGASFGECGEGLLRLILRKGVVLPLS